MKNKLFSAAINKGIVDEEKRIVHVIASTGCIDRHGDSVNPNGWLLDNYMKNNPAVLISHDYYNLPVGKCVRAWAENNELHMNLQITAATEEGNKVWALIQDGCLNSVSVGFMVKKWGVSGQDDYTIMEQELLEVSWVAVPANPEAKVTDKNFKAKVEDLEKIIKEKGVKAEVIEKAGRTISKANEDKITSAIKALEEVIASIGGTDEDADEGKSLVIMSRKDLEELLDEKLAKYKIVQVKEIIKEPVNVTEEDREKFFGQIRDLVRESNQKNNKALSIFKQLVELNSSKEKGGEKI